MAKTMKAQTIFGKDLEKVAEKFGKIPNSYTKSGDIIAAGLLTQEEFDNLPYCPRSQEMGNLEGCPTWPKIGGRKTYPLSGALNAQETEAYYNYKKLHKPAAVSGGVSSAQSEEHNKKVDALIAELRALNVPENVIAQAAALKKVKKNTILFDMFGVDSVQDLKGHVNLAYVMFRGPDGEFSEELEPSMVDLVTKGFMPKFTLQQVKDNIAKLKEKGILVEGVIVDLK